MSRQRFVFVTKTVANGGVLAAASANTICNDEAATAPSTVTGRSFVAWLSTPDNPAAKRHVHGESRYVLPSGRVVANNWAQLTSGSLVHAIDEESSGAMIVPNTRVWTGSFSSGGSTSFDCNAWMSSGGDMGTFGDPAATDSTWSNKAREGCDNTHALYCIES